MITEELTEEFVENHYFVLEKPYEVRLYNENGFPIDEYTDLEIGSEWQIEDDSYLTGNICICGGGMEITEIQEDEFRECFSAHEYERSG